jgi:hypothetical protein
LELHFSQSAAFRDQLDHHLIRTPHNVLARNAFRDPVVRYLPSDSTLPHFRRGTGLDAQ